MIEDVKAVEEYNCSNQYGAS